MSLERIEVNKKEKKELERKLDEAEHRLLEEETKAKRIHQSLAMRQEKDEYEKSSYEKLQEQYEAMKQSNRLELDRLSK